MSPAATATYYVRSENGTTGCYDTDSVTITVSPIATVDAGGPQTVCADGSITLAGFIGGSASNSTWTSSNGGSFSDASSLTSTYTPSIVSGSVTLTLTTDDPSGPCGAVSDTVVITVNPVATVDAGSPQIVCADGSITLAGSRAGGASSSTWTSSNGGTFSNVNSLTSTYTPSIASGTVTLTLTTDDPNGPCGAVSDTVVITVNPVATVDAGTPQTVCADGAIMLAGSLSGGAASSTWSSSNGGTFSNANSLTSTYSPSIASGTVTLTLTTDDPSGPCGAVSDTVVITVNPVATVDAGNPQTVCADGSITLAGSRGGGASSSTWSSSNGGTFSNVNSLTSTYTPSIASGTVTLTLTTDNPNGPCDAVSDTVVITVNPIATVDAGSPQTVCDNGTITLAGSIGGGASSSTWTSSNGGTFSNANSLTSTYSPSIASGTVTLTLTTDDPSGPCNAVSDTVVITVKDDIVITTQPSNIGVCVTETASLSIVAVGDDRTYQWYKSPGGAVSNSANITGATSNILTFNMTTTSDAGSYYVIVSGDNACASATSNTVSLNVNQVITITDQPDDATLCEGSDITFTVAATGSIASYQWRKDGVNISGATGTSYTINNINASDDANYDVVISSPGGLCSAAYSSIVHLTVTEIPTASISYAGSPFCDTLGAGQSVSLSGTNAYTGGTFTAPAGLNINTTTGDINPSASSAGTYTVTYTIPASGGCAQETATASVTITAQPTASISYAGSPFCDTLGAGQSVSLSGTNAYTGGTFTAPAGLNINVTTGDINPSASSAGTYTVTYTIPASGGCAQETATTSVTVTAQPTASISYADSPFCDTLGAGQSVSLSGTNAYTGGTFTAPAGLNINVTTGDIDPSASSAGTYTVTYTIPASGGCAQETATTSVTITAQPTASISYAGSPFCDTLGASQSVSLFGTNAYTGGAFTAPAGLNINATTGDINPSASSAGTYTVTYTIPASGGCAQETATASVTVTAQPTASISYAGSPFCDTLGAGQSVSLSGTNAYTGGTFTAPAGLNINATTGDINPSASSAGTYTVTYTIPASGGCAQETATTSVTITAQPMASINYPIGLCESDSNTYTSNLSQSGGPAGSYTYVVNSGGPTLSINTTTGTITPNTSNIGNYTITYIIPASNGCGIVITQDTVSIEPEPDASFSYASADFCSNETDPVPTIAENGGTFTATPAGIAINGTNGTIDVSASTSGTYRVYYTFAAVANGCGQVQTYQDITISEFITGGTIEGFATDDQGTAGDVSDQIIACHEGNGTLTLDIGGLDTSYIQEWQYNNGGGWTTVPVDNTTTPATTTAGNPGNLEYGFKGLIGGTAYRVLLSSGSACGNVYSEAAYVSVIPPDLKPEPVEATPIEYCLGGTSTFSSSVNFGGEDLNSGGLFQTGQINTQNPDSWLVDGAVRGLSAAGNNLKNNNWSGTNPHPISVGGVNNVTWTSGEPKFAIAGGVLNQNQQNDPYYYEGGVAMTTLTTPIFSLLTLQDAIFTFDEAFVLSGPNTCTGPNGTTNYPAGQAIIQISTDGGTNWNNIPDDEITDTSWRTGAVVTGSNSPVVNSGNLTGFNVNTTTVDLSGYFGNTTMRIRFVLVRNCESVWALDNIELPNVNGETEVEWTDEFDNVLPVIAGTNSVLYTPYSPGYQKFTVTTYINGCRSLEPDGSEDVFLTVHYSNAGPAREVDPNNCGSSVNLHAYDNRKSPRTNFFDYWNEGTWGNWYILPGDTSFTPNLLNGSDFLPTLGPNDIAGTWSISSYSGLGTVNLSTPANYFDDINDPRSEFSGPGGDYVLTWTTPNNGNGGNCSSDVTVTLADCATLDFDGENDHVNYKNNFDLNTNNFSIEVWVKPDAMTNDNNGTPSIANNTYQTIFSKRNGNGGSNGTPGGIGYDLRLKDGAFSFNWDNNSIKTADGAISTNRWYHVAVTYENNIGYKLYVDGIEIATSGGSAPSATGNNFDCIMGAMDQAGNPPNKPVHFFSGWLDELRVWDVTLTEDQIHVMMNQEIESSGGNVIGSITGPDVATGLSWGDLLGYYQMNVETKDRNLLNCDTTEMTTGGDLVGGYLIDNSGNGIVGRPRNITTQQDETAPLPYTARIGGQNWETDNTWLNFDVLDPPNSTGINGARIDWNIAQSCFDISSSNQDLTLLGLVQLNGELTITDNGGTQDETSLGTGLWITHYLKLDGVIDLIGESQLVQKRYTLLKNNAVQLSESILDVSSSGYIERDQQGATNYFNYNYWASPVSTINTSNNNTPFTVNTVMRDGTSSASPLALQWTSSYDPNPATIGKTLSNRWIYTYENFTSNTYLEWRYVGQNTAFNVGLGYTMKGSGAPGALQNYVFMGKPNNGDITTPINKWYNALVGNPYPSAIDATEFIKDNIPSQNPNGSTSVANPNSTESLAGTLFFWIHFDSNNTHILRDYEGGYAYYTLSGGVPPVSGEIYNTKDNYYISGSGGSSLIPGDYIPVGQGFFTSSAVDYYQGPNIKFENDQRYFVREQAPNSLFLKQGSSKKSSTSSIIPPKKEDTSIQRIRFIFTTPEGNRRYLLLAFTPNNEASDGFDYGYDGRAFNNYGNDMVFMLGYDKLVIQGVGQFDENKQYPIGLFSKAGGPIEIGISAFENLPNSTKVYIYDSLLGTYTRINDKNQRFNMVLDAGDFLNRFYITFKKENNSLSIDDEVLNDIIVNYLQNSQEIYIKIPKGDNIKQVYLNNMLGQTVKSWNKTNTPSFSNEMKIPVSRQTAEGTYIIEVQTTSGTMNKKIVISN
ncbi:LamG-like jellyroll fold domain-containing protein [uncultured Algibacter sp.]|uniref:LamG-like jellyroll fold domain-containing protein n=1 Tax=uncultured Algibacter sp. TaxID=298659 RepID=UPI002638EAC5|nr:LamG-like jellyroll fold domain-containing protein [uncultured Algibacter sp.]